MKQYFFSLLFTIAWIATIHGQPAIINGLVTNFKGDTIKIVLQWNGITRHFETHSIPVNNKGEFTDTLQIAKPVYFYTDDGSNYVSGLIEPNDNVTIQYDADNANASLKFYGKGREKMSFINSLVKLKLYNHLNEQLSIAKTKKYPFDYLFNYADSVGDSMFSKLDSIKSFMKPESYSLLKADIKATVMGNKYRSVGLIYHESVDKTLQDRQNELTKSSKQYLQHVLNFDETLFYSSSYVNEVYNILYLDYDGRILSNQIDTGLVTKYDYLNSRLPLSLSIPVLTLFIGRDINKLNQTGNIEELKTVIQHTYKNLQDSSYKNYIERRFNDVTSFKKGMDAPDFVLENEIGEKVSLASFKGKVIYLDFWYAACGPCHALFETLKPIKELYSQNDNVVFLTVSIDSKAVWEKALKNYNIEGYQVFTENKEGNHPIIKAYKVAGYPTTYLIDRNGKIFMTNPSNNPDELQKEIEEALTIGNN